MSFTRPQPPSLTFTLSLLPERLRDGLGKKIQRGLTIARNEGIDVHQAVQPIQRMFCNAGDDHACIAVTHKSHVLQIFVCQEIGDVRNVRLEANRRCERVCVVFQSAQQWNPNRVYGLFGFLDVFFTNGSIQK